MAEHPTFWVGNLNPSITQSILNDDETAHDLTGQTVTFKMRALGSSTLKVNAAATIVGAATLGNVRYDWITADVDTAGEYLCWWTVTTTVGGKTQDVFEAVIEFRAHSNANVYVELEQLKSTLELTGQTFADQDVLAAAVAASRGIDDACDRRFYLDVDATQVRYFTPAGGDLVFIDDLTVLTSLQVDQDGDGVYEQTWTQTTDFLLEPFNSAADGWPYTRIRQTPTGRYLFISNWPHTVKVTGQFGWPAVPAPIKTATTILAARLVKRMREAPLGVVAGFDTGALMIARSDPDVQMLLQPYRRRGALIV